MMRVRKRRAPQVFVCPKCEGLDISVKFEPGTGGFRDPGRLACYCRRCTFRWLQPTADDNRESDA